MEVIEVGNDQPKITSKRVKVEEITKEEDDRISLLPDGLLVEILSRLPTTKTAIQTGTLSKRWKSLWTSVSSFIFINRDIPSYDFVSLVEKTLSECRPSKLRKFVVETYDIPFESQVHDWIRYAISCNVEELKVRCEMLEWIDRSEEDVEEPYVLDFSSDVDFYVNSYFTDLNLSYCIFNPTGAISWKSLKSLSISYGSLGVDVIYNILSGSPLLENLELHDSFGDWQLGITSKSIKRLVLSRLGGDNESRADNFIRYAIDHNLEDLDLSFYINYYLAETMLIEDVFINSCFTVLKLTCCIFNPKGTIDWKRLRILSIHSGSLNEDVIEKILNGSPQLETLVLGDCYGYRCLNVVSKSVKKLEFIKDSDCMAANYVEISAPNILSLKIEGCLHLLKLVLSSVRSLVEAELGISIEHKVTPGQEKMAKGLVRRLRHVKELIIENSCSKAMAMLTEYKEAMQKKNKKVTLKKYEQDRDPQFLPSGSLGNCNTSRAYVGSISEELQQLKEKIQRIEHEKVELEAKQVMQEVEKEQLKEKIQKMEQERVMREAEREQLKEKIQRMENEQAEREAQEIMREASSAQLEAKMKELQDKIKTFEELYS